MLEPIVCRMGGWLGLVPSLLCLWCIASTSPARGNTSPESERRIPEPLGNVLRSGSTGLKNL